MTKVSVALITSDVPYSDFRLRNFGVSDHATKLIVISNRLPIKIRILRITFFIVVPTVLFIDVQLNHCYTSVSLNKVKTQAGGSFRWEGYPWNGNLTRFSVPLPSSDFHSTQQQGSSGSSPLLRSN